MSIFDLIFILGFLASVGTLITLVVALLRGRRKTVLRIVRIYGMCAVNCFAIDFAFAFVSPQSVISIASPWCFDEWCLTVTHVTHSAAGAVQIFDVVLKLFSQARRTAQRANGAWVYLIDNLGRRYAPAPNSSDVPLNMLLQPGESIRASRRFSVPANVSEIGLITGHGGPYCGAMSVLIIGSAGCLFNKPTMVRIQ